MALIRLNPIARKRLRRFREIRRAHWSFWLLVLLYVISLCSELICNSVPLVVRFEGRSFFPVLKFYPDNMFTGSGKFTRPNYKDVEESPAFAGNTANHMVWPLFRYGPYEVVNPARIDIEDHVTLRLAPEPNLGSVGVDPSLRIVRATAAGTFFGVPDRDARGRILTDHWRVPPELLAALRERFANRRGDRVSVVCRDSAGRETELSCPAFSPRQYAPKTLRITLREHRRVEDSVHEIAFDARGHIMGEPGELWPRIGAADRDTLVAEASERFSKPVDARTVTIGQAKYRASYDRQEIRFPFRPVREHWMGIDSSGRDVFARVLYGLRTSMTFGLILVLCSLCIGTLVGSVQGYFGGLVDLTGQRLIEIWSALPFLYVMILMGSVYGRGLMLLIFCYGLFNWIGMSYYMRAEMLRLRKQPFVEAARCLGLPPWKIVVRHILPNALVPLITFFPFSLVGAIGSLAALDYLGFGLPPPTPSWGELLQQAQEFRWAWWLILFPSLALFCVMLMGVFVGEGVRNAFDPRRYSRMR